MKCPNCNKRTKRTQHEMDGVPYEANTCPSCKEGFLDMSQLHELGAEHKKMREAKGVTFSQWGNSLAVRIPKDLALGMNIKAGTQGRIIKDKKDLRIILEK